ncbi:MAG: LamG domain-containing protein [Verrucomicrobia bacterium]|jgi:hypothetical protein|nr:LamG domain-containing protein [Verrucomicrobiota bacterium]
MKSQANLNLLPLLCSNLLISSLLFGAVHAQSLQEPLVEALTFYASFDKGIEADVAKGDPSLYTITSKQPKEVIRRGLHAQGQTEWVTGAGIDGGAALKFNDRNASWIFYRGEKNVDYQTDEWSGTVSLWLKLDPETDLAPGFADPLQLTTRAWNDGSFFVDFNKDGNPRDFRLGAFADLKVWNPDNKEIPENKRPLLPVQSPPFGKDQWTHVLFTWSNYNSGDKEGVAKLYLNGELKGEISGWSQTFTWKSEETIKLYLGLNYIGLLDEVSCFDRVLTSQEIKWYFLHPGELVQKVNQ